MPKMMSNSSRGNLSKEVGKIVPAIEIGTSEKEMEHDMISPEGKEIGVSSLDMG